MDNLHAVVVDTTLLGRRVEGLKGPIWKTLPGKILSPTWL